MLRIINNIGKFSKEYFNALDRALNRIAIDIERLSKTQVPLDKGQLRASGYHRRLGFLNYRIIYNKEYARYQEFGGDDRRVVRHYTTPGTKKFYLRDPGNLIKGRALEYLKRELGTIKV